MTRQTVAHRALPMLAVALLVGACGTGATPSAAPTPTPTAMPTAAPTATSTPTPTTAPTAVPTPTPTQAPIAYGAATVVEGVESCEPKEGTDTVTADGTTQSRGWVLTCTDTSNDPRVTGTVTYDWNFDRWGSGMEFAHVQWGSGRLENAGGAWEGTLTGSFSTKNGDLILFWFEGTGGYEGLSYAMWTVLPIAEAGWTYKVKGIIFPGSPPAP